MPPQKKNDMISNASQASKIYSYGNHRKGTKRLQLTIIFLTNVIKQMKMAKLMRLNWTMFSFFFFTK